MKSSKNRGKSRPALAGTAGGEGKTLDDSPCGGATQLWSIKETAQRLRVSEREVARLISSNELASVKLGRRRLILEADLASFVESRRAKGGGS